jgi:hypothetical protein
MNSSEFRKILADMKTELKDSVKESVKEIKTECLSTPFSIGFKAGNLISALKSGNLRSYVKDLGNDFVKGYEEGLSSYSKPQVKEAKK